jgi:hypothetical protein
MPDTGDLRHVQMDFYGWCMFFFSQEPESGLSQRIMHHPFMVIVPILKYRILLRHVLRNFSPAPVFPA